MSRWILTATATIVVSALTAADLPGGEIGAAGQTAATMGTDFSRRTGRLGFGHDPRARPETDFFGASGLGRARGDIFNPVDEGIGARTTIAPFPVVKPTAPVRPQRREDNGGRKTPAARGAFD